MIPKLINALKQYFKRDLDQWLFSKKTILTVLLSISCVILNDLLVSFINEYFTIYLESGLSADFWVLIIFGYFIWYALYLLFKLKYILSFSQKLLLWLFVLQYSLIRLSGELNFIPFHLFEGIYYVDVLALPFFLFFMIYQIKRIVSFIEDNNEIKKLELKSAEKANIYISDSPKNEFHHERMAEEISKVIIENKFDVAFSIGVTGQWGQGKSSLLKDIESRLSNQNDILTIQFSPFLNHKEDDVVSEFFTVLGNKLGRYSGQLSKNIIQYAQSISSVYKKGDFSQFLNNNITSDKSATELYDSINEQIGQINKTIVVFIDDLDRLNSKEIIQVLKLIRNSSNFRRTFFILALDKNYVVNAISAERSYSEIQFIDKFFQLETYLPEIAKSKLINFIDDSLTNRLNSEQYNIERIINEFSRSGSLFKYFINNYRDCIRLINQIVLDQKILENLLNEINTADVVNIIFLKLRFPKAYYSLIRFPRQFLVLKDDRYLLGPKTDTFPIDAIVADDFDHPSNIDLNQYAYLDEYFPSEKDSNYKYSIYDKRLLIHTLVSLFSTENVSPKSIQFKHNFYKLARLQFEPEDIRENEVKKLFDKELNIENMLKEIIELSKTKNLQQLIHKSSIYLNDSFGNERYLIISLFTLSISDTYSDDAIESIIRLLNLKTITENQDSNTVESTFKKHFFSDFNTSLKTKLKLLRKFNEVCNYDSNWSRLGLKNDFSNKVCKMCVDQFIQSIDEGKAIDSGIELYNEVMYHLDKTYLRGVWLNNVFTCENLLDHFCKDILIKPHPKSKTFIIKQATYNFFDSTYDFYKYLEPKKNDAVWQEYLEFLKIYSILKGRIRVNFEFSNSELVNDNIDVSENETYKDIDELQVILKVNPEYCEFFGSLLFLANFNPDMDLRILLEFENEYFIFAWVKNSDEKNFQSLFQRLNSRLNNVNSSIDFDNERIIDEHGKTILSVYSKR